MKLPFLPSVWPMRKCRVGKQNLIHPGFTLAKLVQSSPGSSFLWDSHSVLSNGLNDVLKNFLIALPHSLGQWTNFIFIFCIFLQKLKKWHRLRKKNYQKGPQNACSTYLFKHLLQLSWNQRREPASIFVIARNLMMGTPRTGDKSAIQNKYFF